MQQYITSTIALKATFNAKLSLIYMFVFQRKCKYMILECNYELYDNYPYLLKPVSSAYILYGYLMCWNLPLLIMFYLLLIYWRKNGFYYI